MMGAHVQLVLWESRQPDTYIITNRQQGGRIVAFVMGRIGARSICGPALFKSPWPMYPSLSLFMHQSSRGGISGGRVKCSSSVWKRSSMNANASGEAERREQLWKEYFADPSQWWDNRADKRNPKAPDFKHKVTREALWVDGWSTPSWVRATLKLVIGDNLQPCVGDGSTRDLRPIVQGSDVGMYMHNASTNSEAFAILKNHLEGGRIVDMKMYIDILQQCLKERDLVLTKQVHDCIKKSGLEQKAYVVNNLMRVYIRCGRLLDARKIFDKLVKKDVFSWTSMIEGYAKHDCSEDAMEVFNQMLQEGGQPNEYTYSSILKAFANPTALEWGKIVHAYIKRGGFESNMRVGNALVHMYVKSGSIEDARLVFDKMVERDVITWTMMIGGLAEHGCGQEAYEVFVEMHKVGFVANECTYLSILNACASVGALEWVKKVHKHALKAGYGANLHVGNALVHMYVKSGSIEDALLVLDRMVERDVITWNVMIGGLTKHGRGQEAYELFLQMDKGGFVPDECTYVNILNPCASVGALEWVKEVHKHALKAGYGANLRVGNALVHVYVKIGSIEDAQLIFDRMVERDVITWNVMIGGLAEHGRGQEAYEVFLQMHKGGFVANECTYVSILNPCASAGALEWVKEVDKHALKAGYGANLRVSSALIHMYVKSGNIEDARLVFDRMVEHDVITWNVIIGGLAEHGHGQEAYKFFVKMHEEGFVANECTYVSILNACASAGALEWVKEVHKHALKVGYGANLRVGSALMNMYVKSGSIEHARLVFDRMVEHDVITWNVMIGGLAKHGRGQEAYELFVKMQRQGIAPNTYTYMSILNPCASVGALEWVKEVHICALRAGFDVGLLVGSALIHMYAKSGSIEDARLVFAKMVERDVITWNVMIGGLAEHGHGHEVLQLFGEMNLEGVKPNVWTFVAILSACSHAGLVDEGWCQFLAMMQDYGMDPTLEHYNCMVDLLGRAGRLEEAYVLIRDMPLEPNVVTWRALLGACRTHGNVALGELAFKESVKLDPICTSTYVLLSNIYAVAGKWDQVALVRSMMQERGICKEPGRSWIEVDDKIHSFVVGDTSHPKAKEIHAELKSLMRTLKAEGYIPDTRFVLHDVDEKDKELALCSHSEKLAIAYGLLCTPNGEPIRIYKNLRVCSDCHTATKFISKVTGREIVARDANRFHHFKDGMCSCGDYW